MNKRTAVAMVVVLLALGGALVVWKGRSCMTGAGPAPDAAPQTPTATSSGTDPAQAPPVMQDRPVSEQDDPAGSLRLEGQVLDTDDHPVAGATVWVSARPERTVVSEADGSFAVDGLIERTYWITATVDELAGGPAQHALSSTSDPVIIRVRQGGVLEVEVVGDAQRPVRDAAVSVSGIVQRSATTDETGVATLRGIPSGGAPVRVQAAGYAPANELALLPQTAGAVVRLRVQLARGAAVSGFVIDADRKPVAGAVVTPRAASEWIPLSDADSATTDELGAWRLPAVSAGSFQFNASHPDHAPGSSETVSLDGATEATGIAIALEPGATVAGKVVTADGAPAPYATVRLGPTDWNMWSGWDVGVRQAIADDAGAFSFKGLKAVPVSAVATKDDAASATTTIDLAATPSATGVVLTLDVTGAISGVVVDESGAPMAEATVSAWPDFMGGEAIDDWVVRGALSATSDGAGAFAFTGLPDGAYRLRAGRGGRGSEMVMLQPGVRAEVGDTDVRVVLEGEGGVKGKVELDDGSKPAAFTVRVGWTTPVPVAQKDGAFELTELPAGSYDVTIDGAGFARKTVPDVDIETGSVVDLGTIVVKPGRSVFGRVVDSAGRAVPNANVVLGKQLFSDGTTLAGGLGGLLDAQSGIRRATTDARGDYRVNGVPKAVSYIAAELPELGRSNAFTVAAGTDDVRLDLPLRAFGKLEGTVTAASEPVEAATVMVSPPDQMAPIMVNTGDDGAYVVDKLPEGTYAMTAMLLEGGMNSRTAASTGTIAAGKTTVVDIDIKVGNVALTVIVATEDGSELTMAQIVLVPGNWSVQTASELQRAFFRGIDGAQSQIARQGKHAEFTRLEAGRYSACIIPFGGDMNDPKFLQRIQENPDLLEVHCRAVTVKDAPASQTFETTVPAMKPLPPPEQ